MNPHVGSIAVAFVQLLASMLSGLLIDTVGRIPLLIISSVFMSLALASFGSYAYYDKENKMLGGDTDWIPLLCVLVFTIAFSLGKWHTHRTFVQFFAHLWSSEMMTRNVKKKPTHFFLCAFCRHFTHIIVTRW